MQLSGPALVLSNRPFGERDTIVSVITREAGRVNGLVRGGQSSKQRNAWQAGHLMNAAWRARLLDHLGTFSGEMMQDFSSRLLHAPLGLAALLAALSLTEACTPERMPYPAIYDALDDLLPLDETLPSLARYVHFECALLAALGYGLDFSSCALTGTVRDLAYVSPKTGRAVNREAASVWADKLLPLPDFLRDSDSLCLSWDAVAQGLALTGHFLEGSVFIHLQDKSQKNCQEKRNRLLERIAKQRNVAVASAA